MIQNTEEAIKNGQSRMDNQDTLDNQEWTIKTHWTIKNGQSRHTGQILHSRQTKQKAQHNTTQKPKRMCNMDPTTKPSVNKSSDFKYESHNLSAA